MSLLAILRRNGHRRIKCQLVKSYAAVRAVLQQDRIPTPDFATVKRISN